MGLGGQQQSHKTLIAFRLSRRPIGHILPPAARTGRFFTSPYYSRVIRIMRSGFLTDTSRIIVVGILMSIVLLLPQINPAAHNPLAGLDATTERHYQLDYEPSDHAGHSHENGTSEELSLDHQHGHNSADHTHNPVFLSVHALPAASSIFTGRCTYTRSYLPPPPSQHLRPPQPLYIS